jgi:hypothetical protein
MIKVWSKWSHARATHGTEVSLVPLLTKKNSSLRPWIYNYFNDGQNLRDECWLLEIAGRGKPERFFDCGDSRDIEKNTNWSRRRFTRPHQWSCAVMT